MKKIIELPVSQLSLLKKVHMEMDMTGEHLELLVKRGKQEPDVVALSILSDLVEEDVSLLSVSEASYLFHLVKLYNLQDKLVVTVNCPSCGCANNVDVNLAKGTYAVPKPSFRVPKVTWTFPGQKPEEYRVFPITLSRENAVKDWCATVKDKSMADAKKDADLEWQITAIRALSCLVDKQGHHVFETGDFDNASEIFRANKFITIRKLLQYSALVAAYGPQLSSLQITCKECNKDITFRLSILAGLVD